MKLGDIGHFFKTLGEKIHAGLVKIFGQSALDSFEAKVKTILSEDMVVIFKDAIVAANSLTVGTGNDKRAAAFAQIVKDLEGQGKTLATSTINLGIEMVIGLLKAQGALGFAN